MIDRLALRAVDAAVPTIVGAAPPTSLPAAQARWVDATEWSEAAFEIGFGLSLVAAALIVLRQRRPAP